MAEAEEIIKQIFASEPDYAEIKGRRDALNALPSRTQAQAAEVADYQRMLDRSDTVIGLWLQRLALLQGRTVTQIRSSLGNVTNQQVRTQVLAALKAKNEADAAEYAAERVKADATEFDDIRKIQRELVEAAIGGDPVQEMLTRIADRRRHSTDLQAREAACLARAQAINTIAAGPRILGN
jgi:hypothetical protein